MIDPNTQTLNGSNDEFGSTDTSAANSSMLLVELMDTLRRRWWLLVLGAIGGIAFLWWRQRDDIPTYTAEVLIQRQVERAALDPANPMLAITAQSQQTGMQVEILRSRAVIGPVVDALAMRVQIDGQGGAAPDWLTDVRLPPDSLGNASVGFLLELDKSGATVIRRATLDTVARVNSGEVVNHEGMSFRVATQPDQPVTLSIRVISRENAVTALLGSLDVEPSTSGNGLIRVRYTSIHPELAARVANAVAVSFQNQATQQTVAAASARRAFLERQFSQWADSLAVAQRLLSEHQEGSGMLDPRAEGAALATALLDAEKQQGTLKFQEGLLRSVITALRSNQQGSDAIRQVVALSGDLIPTGAELYTRLRQYEMERSAVTTSRYGLSDTNQRVEVLDSMIAGTREEIRSIAEQALTVLVQRRQDSDAQAQRLRAQVGQVPAQLSSLDRLQQRVEGIQRTFDLLGGRYYEAQINEAMGSESTLVTILDPAIVPTSANGAQGRHAVLLAALVGLLLGFGAALGLESLDATVRHAVDAERSSGIQVIAMIPRMQLGKNGRTAAPLISTGELGGAADAFRTLRTALRFTRTQYPKILAVTSPGPGDGKSVISSNLAISLAQQQGWRVLLIDADLRRPRLHTMFGIPRSPGLSDLLVGVVDAAAAIRHHKESRLDLLVCGTVTTAPAELVGSETFKTFLERARERYDAIVIDTPPVLIAAETTALAPWLDGMLVTARAQLTNRFALRRAVDQLRQVNAPVLGLLLNDLAAGGGYGRYSGYAGYYGYKYYHTDYSDEAGPKRRSRLRGIFKR